MFTGRQYYTMKNKSTTFLIFALVIVVCKGDGLTAIDNEIDLVAEEAKNRAVTIVDGPKNLTKPANVTLTVNLDVPTHRPDPRPPSKPPIVVPDLPKQTSFIDVKRPFYGQIQKLPPPHPYYKTPLKLPHNSNSLYQFPRVIPLPPHHKAYYIKQSAVPRPHQFVASTHAPIVTKPPKFSVPVQTINGIRTEVVRPPKHVLNATSTTTTTTTTETTTTAKVLRTKRIWPKKQQQKTTNAISDDDNFVDGNWTKIFNATENEKDTAESQHRVRYVQRGPTPSTTPYPTTKKSYRPVTRLPKKKATTLSPDNFTRIEPNDWVPVMPSHYRKLSIKPQRASRRSDTFSDADPEPNSNKQIMYLQSFGLLPITAKAAVNPTEPSMIKKKMVIYKPKRQLNQYYSGYHTKHMHSPVHSASMPVRVYGDLQPEESHQPRVVTKVKHHHHHHHHRYIKTVEKPIQVPYKVEVPKPYPVPVEKQVPVPVEKIKVVEKKVPYPVPVEKRVPYPIGIQVPHPVPVKVVEKEYVPKPYAVVQQVPVIKHVQVKVPQPVPVTVEKKVPYPVEVQVRVPVDRPVPVPVTVEKKVPYPVPVRVLVPQPYPVEKRVPYPVEKEIEVIKHIPIRVPFPQPYAVKVPHPVPVHVEKRVPYPVEVEKKVPVPVEVYVPQRVEVEKKVPIYVPKPYPVEKKVPYPVKVPVPVRVPVPVQVPVYIHEPYTIYENAPAISYQSIGPTDTPVQHTVTVHGNGFQSRSDDTNTETTTTSTEKPS